MVIVGPCSPTFSGLASSVTRAAMTFATLAMGSGLAWGVDASTPAPSAPTAPWAWAGQGRSRGLPRVLDPARLWVAATAPTGRSSLTTRRTTSSAISPRAIRDGLMREKERSGLWSVHASRQQDRGRPSSHPGLSDHHHDDHDHGHGAGSRLDRLLHALPFVHGHGEALGEAWESSARGLWALKVSLAGLGVTAAIQLAIVVASGSVGLLADSIHNVADALTAVPLGLAFLLARRPPSRRYTYGLGRAEELAGVVIVLTIFASALLAAWESYQRLLHPQPLRNVGWVIAAALIGFLGNEAVAVFRIRVGSEIGSAALIADGQHARADGFTSLAVLVGALLVLAGFPLADPIVGLLITVAILLIVRGTAVTMWHRLLDGVDPQITADIEAAALKVPAVQSVRDVRARWVGHQLLAEVSVVVDGELPTRVSHQIAEDVSQSLRKAVPRLATATVHVDPVAHAGQHPRAGGNG